jgi:predicted adenylyl cyclase CyaB
MKNIEVEVKIKLWNTDKWISNLLDKLWTKEKVEEYQKDKYYTVSHENFMDERPKVNKRLRTRTSDKWDFITFKHRHTNSNGTQQISCDEIETSIWSSSQVDQLFLRLDMKLLATVEKRRSTWTYKNCEIAIDKVWELWYFIEIENKWISSSIDDAKNNIRSIVSELKLNKKDIDSKWYPYLVLEKNDLL